MLKSETRRLRSGREWQIHSGGNGPALLWLHGFGGVDAGDPLLAALQSRHRLVAPVAPGFADLAELAEIDDVHDLALDYDDLLEALDLDRLAVIGHSFGAMMAAEIAAHVPHRVARLVLLAPIGLWNDAYPVADVFAQPGGDIDGLLWHDTARRDAHIARLAAEVEGLSVADRTISVVRRLTAVTKFLWPIPDKGLRRRLPRIAAPTLVLLGAEDAVLSPRYAADFTAGLRHGRAEVIAGAGHMLAYERPEAVLRQVESFLAEGG